GIAGNCQYNNGWHTAMDLDNMLVVSEAITRAALLRKESRGAQFREDFPEKDPEWGKYNIVFQRGTDGEMRVEKRAIQPMHAELNGVPKLMCMTRLSDLNLDMPVIVEPMHAFPSVRDLVTDVSWNFRVKKTIKRFKPRTPDAPDGTWRMQQADVERVQEFRKCIECFLCQDVCHVLRDHQMHNKFIGPRFLIHVAALEMHPLDTEDRLEELRNAQGIGYCNITKCCTKVCPENIEITDNGIIPLKERMVDKFYDPLGWFWRWLKRR